MERAGDHRRSKNSGLLRFLAKSTSFSIPRRHFYNPPRERSYFSKAFSGPIVSIIPAEARHREEKRSTVDGEEPLSPKVSCIGRIKGKKRSSEPGRRSPPSVQQQQQQQQQEKKKKKKKKKQQQAYFSFRAGKATEESADEKGRRSGAAVGDGSTAPRIGEMRRFASGRETIADFDWRKCESTAYNHEVIIAYSAPLMVGGSGGDRAVAVAPEPEPRKEVNIWKRRTMAPPRPLQV